MAHVENSYAAHTLCKCQSAKNISALINSLMYNPSNENKFVYSCQQRHQGKKSVLVYDKLKITVNTYINPLLFGSFNDILTNKMNTQRTSQTIENETYLLALAPASGSRDFYRAEGNVLTAILHTRIPTDYCRARMTRLGTL